MKKPSNAIATFLTSLPIIVIIVFCITLIFSVSESSNNEINHNSTHQETANIHINKQTNSNS